MFLEHGRDFDSFSVGMAIYKELGLFSPETHLKMAISVSYYLI